MAVQGEFFEVPHVGTLLVTELSKSTETTASTGAELHSALHVQTGAQTPSSIAEHTADSPSKIAPRRGMKDLSIPKLYYSISEVSRLTGLEQYVLRYWETEFDELRPQKNRAGNRIYSNKDIKFILHIKDLLREKRYTIEGAKQILQEERSSSHASHAAQSEKIETVTDVHQSEKAEGSAGADASTDQLNMLAEASKPVPVITREDLAEIKSALLELRAALGGNKA